jgi:hypothetical protein
LAFIWEGYLKRLVFTVVMLSLGLTGCGGGSGGDTFEVKGTIALLGLDDFSCGSGCGYGSAPQDGTACTGISGFSDFLEGSKVAVMKDGKTLGLGEMGAGTVAHYPSSVACEFPISIKDVPSGEKFYELQVGTRPAFQMTESEAKAGTLNLTAGQG